MTSGLHIKFDKAVLSVKEALHAAIDAENFDENTLSEVWRHYQGLKSIAKRSLPEHEEHDEIKFDLSGINTTPTGYYDPFGKDPFTTDMDDDNIEIKLPDDAVGAADTVPVFGGSGLVGGAGSDVITFS